MRTGAAVGYVVITSADMELLIEGFEEARGWMVQTEPAVGRADRGLSIARAAIVKGRLEAIEPTDDIHDLKARLNVLVPAMEQIAAIAAGSTTANSLPHIARIASVALVCQEA